MKVGSMIYHPRIFYFRSEKLERLYNFFICMSISSVILPLFLMLKFQNRAGLRQFLDSFGGTEQSATVGNSVPVGLSQESSTGSVVYEKPDTKSRTEVKLSHLASGTDSNSYIQTTETRLTDLLDSTLWNRKLAPSSERIVYALVQQIFHGIREYFLASAELKVLSFLQFYFVLI